jgi:RNA polymerase sigma-70 factor (ECF subfamily)
MPESNLDWSDVVEQHSSIVWRTIHRLIPQTTDAADCFQATFISAWQVSQKQTIQNWPAMLRCLATARALDRYRQLARHRSRYEILPSQGLIDGRLREPIKIAEATELEELLRMALAEIDPQEAEVFCLACLDELTYREISSELGLSVNHVGVILNRARSKLRARLGAFIDTSNTPEKDNAK